MNRAHVNDVELEYEVRGDGEPVLLIHGAHIANAMTPLLDEPALEGFQLIHYHRRGYAGSSRSPQPSSVEAHADDAVALLDHLGVADAHVVGHSSGAVVALEVGARHPSRTRSLALLEPPFLDGPVGAAFIDAVAPLVARYEAGDPGGAVDGFLALVGRDDWRATIDRAVPGGVDQAERDAATFFETELPIVAAWTFGPGRANSVTCPVLSVLGTDSGPFFAESDRLLHEWFPSCADAVLPGVTHLLQMEATEAVAEAVGTFLRCNDSRRATGASDHAILCGTEAVMYAMVGTSNLNFENPDDAAQMANGILSNLSGAPGFVTGSFARSADGNHGRSMVLFDTKEQAKAAAEDAQANIPADGPVEIVSIEVYEVVAHA